MLVLGGVGRGLAGLRVRRDRATELSGMGAICGALIQVTTEWSGGHVPLGLRFACPTE